MKNKYFKSIIAIMIVIVTLFSLSSCTSKSKSKNPSKPQPSGNANESYFEEDTIQSNIDNEVLQYPGSNDDYEYKVYETYVEITYYTGLSKDVVIPDKIEGLPVKVIGERSFWIRYPNPSDKIEYRTMYDESFDITSVKLPKHLIEIKRSAFVGNALTEIIIPDTVLKLGDGAFESNYLLSNIIFGNSLREIGNSCFDKCNLHDTITLPESLISIGEYAFSTGDDYFYYGDVSYYSNTSNEGRAILRGETTYRDERKYKTYDLTNAKVFEEGNATIVIPSSVQQIDKCAISQKYTIKCPKGSAAVKYITDCNHPLYEIY